jgi:hypothetical protein
MPSSPSGSLPLNGVAAVPGSGSITLSVLDSTIAAQNAVAVGSPSGGANSVSVTTSASSRASLHVRDKKVRGAVDEALARGSALARAVAEPEPEVRTRGHGRLAR